MFTNETVAAFAKYLDTIPASGSDAIKAWSDAQLGSFRYASEAFTRLAEVERWGRIHHLAGGEAAWDALPFGTRGDLVEAGNKSFNAAFPEAGALLKRAWDIGYNTIGREQRRRATNRARINNAAERAANAVQAGAFQPGEKCKVHAFGHWYTGNVIRMTRTGKVVVGYTSGTGIYREKSVGADKVRQAR